MIYTEKNRRQEVLKNSKVLDEGKRVIVFRWLVFCALFCAAVLCGTLSYFILVNSERKNFIQHYESTAHQLKRSVERVLQKYHSSGEALAVIANMQYPHDSSWPNISIPSYYLLDESFQDVTGCTPSTSILPIVQPSELAKFEAHALPFVASEAIVAEYPQQIYKHVGGVWQIDQRGIPFHDTTGASPLFSNREIIVPILNAPLPLIANGLLLVNLHALPATGIVMDDCLECVEAGYESCASMSDFFINTDYETFASASITTPIYSRESTGPNETKKVLGFTAIGFDWSTELTRFSYDLLGIDCVLRSARSNNSYTYFIRNGRVKFLPDEKQDGDGDMHDRKFDSNVVRIPLSLLGSRAQGSASYIMDLYPTRTYFDSFRTRTPLYTSVGLAGMIVFTSFVFFLYDHLVKEDVREKAQVLRMKRDFVRFISHEIRTPLNTVAVGMTLLEEGLQSMRQHEFNAESPGKMTTTKADDDSVSRTPTGSDYNEIVNPYSSIGNKHSSDDRDICDSKTCVATSLLSSVNHQKEISLTEMLELTGDVQGSTAVAVSVLNDLLNFDKLEAGEVKIANEKVRILDLVQSVVKSFKIQAYQKKIQVSWKSECHSSTMWSDDDVIVNGDKFKLGHVVRNLMSNALKFTERYGTIAVKITIVRPHQETSPSSRPGQTNTSLPSTSPDRVDCCLPRPFSSHWYMASKPNLDRILPAASGRDRHPSVSYGMGGKVFISVTDSGHGLSEDQLAALFQDGVQFDPNKLQAGQGSGLGLFLSHKIVALHGGRMWAESDGPDKGATFWISLPLGLSCSEVASNRVTPCPSQHGGPLNTAVASKNNGRTEADAREAEMDKGVDKLVENGCDNKLVNKRDTYRLPGLVLVVDDTSSNRKIVTRVLKTRGFDCMEAKDGQECLKIIMQMSPSPAEVYKCDKFCCVLMDFEMPILNGPDTTKALRDLGYKHPIYGLTGNVMQEDVQHFLESGANDILSKPLDITEFLNMYNGLNDE